MNWYEYKNPHFFRFWCQKVLPLVYDNSLSYYEVLCKLVKYLNDVIADSDAVKQNVETLKEAYEQLKFYVDNYFDNLDIQDEVDNFLDGLKDSGELDGIVSAALRGSLVDTSYYTPFAQVLPTQNRDFHSGKYAQGFAIGKIEGRPVCLTCFTDTTAEGSGNVFDLHYLDTGVQISKNTIESGHCNSATFNDTTKTFFVVTGGVVGAPKTILEYGIDGSVKSEHEIEYGPWAIAWNRDKFYIMCTNARLVTTDNNFNVLSVQNVAMDGDYTYQGMGADDNYIYLPNGNGRFYNSDRKGINRISVFTHTGELVKHIDCMNPLEIEEIAFYDNECYMNSNTQESSFIFKCNLYNTDTPYEGGHANIPSVNSNSQNIYIDETYTGFFCNGTESSPLSSLYWWYLAALPGASRINVNLLSDCSEHVFAFWNNCPWSVTLYGNNHKIARVNWTGSNYIAINDVTLIGADAIVSCHITATRFVCSNLVFGESGSAIRPSRLLEVMGAPMEIISMTINQRSDITWYLMGSGYIRAITTNVDNLEGVFLGGVFSVDSSFPIDKLQDSSIYGLSYKVVIYLNHNINVRELYFPCKFNVPAGTITISGLPDDVSSADVVAIDVDGVATHKSIVHIYTNDGSEHTIINLK